MDDKERAAKELAAIVRQAEDACVLYAQAKASQAQATARVARRAEEFRAAWRLWQEQVRALPAEERPVDPFREMWAAANKG